MKKVLVVLVILCMVIGCSSKAPAPNLTITQDTNQTPAATNQSTSRLPVATVTQNIPVPTTIPTPGPTIMPPVEPETTIRPPSPTPTLTPSLVAGDYCSFPVCDLSDHECLRMQNQYGTLNTCMHLSMDGGVSMWRQYMKNYASPSSYRITDDELVLGIPGGWRIVSFESSSILYDRCTAGSCDRNLDSLFCTANGTVISCFSDAFVYVRATQNQL